MDRLVRDTPARQWVLTTLEDASARPDRATGSLRAASREARKLRSRERRALWDVVYTLIRSECLGGTWPERLDAWLDGTPPEGSFAARAGLPPPIAERLNASWDDPEAWLEASNQRAPTDLRVNLSRTSRERLGRALADAGIETEPIGEAGLQVNGRANLVGHPTFRKGHFELQDRGSQRVAERVDPEGATILDLCAGAGGKSLAMADRRGVVTATDIRSRALDELAHRANRAHLKIRRHTLPRDGNTACLEGRTFDRVLVDAPCSGSGVWRRHPEYRWRLPSLEALEQLQRLQQLVLERGAAHVGPSGRLIYATCSALRDENHHIVEHFVAQHPEWTVQDQTVMSPHTTGSDGLFVAVLTRGAP